GVWHPARFCDRRKAAARCRSRGTQISGRRIPDRRPLSATHRPMLARTLHSAASNAFFDGFAVACLVAAAVALVGAVLAAILIPAHPPQPGAGTLAEEQPTFRGASPARHAESVQ